MQHKMLICYDGSGETQLDAWLAKAETHVNDRSAVMQPAMRGLELGKAISSCCPILSQV